MNMGGDVNCPNCDSVMNHHADKLVYFEQENTTRESRIEFYTCPKCGANASHTAEQMYP